MAKLHTYTQTIDQYGWFKELAPLEWTNAMQQEFNNMHALVAADALASYPDQNKGLTLH